MTTSLVTGGCGFIGSHVADHLLKKYHQVIVLDDLSGGKFENAPDHITFVKGSILDVDLIDRIFRDYRPDYVFHLAAYAAEGLSHYIRRYNYEVNVLGSINLINASVNYGVKRLVFTSSAAVYGDSWPTVDQQEWFDLRPVDPYGVAKAAVESDLRLAQKTFGLPYTIFRMHNVYGERQNLNDPYRNVVGIFMRQCLKGEPMTIYGTGEQSRQFTYIDDVAPYIAECIDIPGAENEIFNIGSPQSATVNGVAAWVAQALSHPLAPKVHLPARREMEHISLDHNKFALCFGVTEFVQPWDGIRAMAKWAWTQTLKEPKPFTEIEISKGLPEHWRQLNVDRKSN